MQYEFYCQCPDFGVLWCLNFWRRVGTSVRCVNDRPGDRPEPVPEDGQIPGFRVFVTALVALALSACGTTSETAGPDSPGKAPATADAEDAPEPAPFSDDGGVPYTVRFEGAAAADLEEPMRAASQLVALKDKTPSTLNALRRRAADDARRMATVLRSKGYYQGTANAHVTPGTDQAEVIVTVDPGTLYLIGDVVIDYDGTPPPTALQPAMEDIGLILGMYAEAQTVITAETALARHFAESGYPAVDVVNRRVTVNHDTQLMSVFLTVVAGPSVTLGDVRFEGAETVRETYLRKLVPWKPGDAYKASIIEEYRRTLRSSGLFGTVAADVETDGADDAAHIERAPVVVSLTETAQRSIGAGADYSTSEGPGLKTFWEHRNIFGESETLRLTAAGSALEQSLSADFRKPEFIARNQDFVVLAEAEREETDAFDSNGIIGRVGLERRSGDVWTTGISATAEISEVTDDTGDRISKLFGTPVFVRRDTSDSALDPTHGSRIGFQATPYVGDADTALFFTVLEATLAAYHALDDDGDIVLAARTRYGSILGEERLDIPADKRFFAGGGGSIRGYAFQLAGPLETDNDPEGGLSVLELGAEARIRVTEDVGIVPFVDGGAAQLDVYPSRFDDILWAGGLGVRYYTPIGPLRLDVALPINGRENVDDAFQFYISIGQAF